MDEDDVMVVSNDPTSSSSTTVSSTVQRDNSASTTTTAPTKRRTSRATPNAEPKRPATRNKRKCEKEKSEIPPPPERRPNRDSALTTIVENSVKPLLLLQDARHKTLIDKLAKNVGSDWTSTKDNMVAIEENIVKEIGEKHDKIMTKCISIGTKCAAIEGKLDSQHISLASSIAQNRRIVTEHNDVRVREFNSLLRILLVRPVD
jgi:hypothetical protein